MLTYFHFYVLLSVLCPLTSFSCTFSIVLTYFHFHVLLSVLCSLTFIFIFYFQFNYHPSTFIKPQIKFLQYLHLKVNQKITYNCKNSVAIDSDDEKSIKLVGFDDSTLSTKGKKSIRYKITEDSCKVRNKGYKYVYPLVVISVS